MSRRVHAPCEVEDGAVSKGACNEEAVPEFFSPIVRGNLCWENEAHVKGEPRVEFSLPIHERVGQEIREVHLATGLDNRWVLFHNQPTDMGVKEPTGCVVRVGLRLGEFVVDSVIASPVVNRSLIGDRVTHHQEESKDEVCFV